MLKINLHTSLVPAYTMVMLNLSIQEAEAGKSPEVWGQLVLHHEFHASQGYTVRPCFRNFFSVHLCELYVCGFCMGISSLCASECEAIRKARGSPWPPLSAILGQTSASHLSQCLSSSEREFTCHFLRCGRNKLQGHWGRIWPEPCRNFRLLFSTSSKF